MKKKIIGIHGAQVKPYFTIAHCSGSFSRVRLIIAIAVVVTYLSIVLLRVMEILAKATSLSVY